MQLPETTDDERALLAKLAANAGATTAATDDRRALMVKILTALAS